MAARPQSQSSLSQIEVVVHPGDEHLGSLEPESLQILVSLTSIVII